MYEDKEEETMSGTVEYAKTSAYGGNGGTPFDDGSAWQRLAGFQINCDAAIDHIQGTYQANDDRFETASKHGRDGGYFRDAILFGEEEWIVEVEGHYDHILRWLQFTTNKGNVYTYGRAEWSTKGARFHLPDASISVPATTFRIEGLYGRSGDYLDQLGFYYLIPEKWPSPPRES